MSDVHVSIGLPVFNGEKYLENAVESILGQTYGGFELIISDNASTDGTEAICRRFAAQDRRVRYHRHQANLGAARNFNDTFERASGRYFKWAAHDDMLAPTFLEKCVQALDDHSEAVLAFPQTRVYRQSIGDEQPYDVPIPLDVPDVARRLRRVLIGHQFYELFGVIRHAVLARTGLMGPHFAADAVLLMQLALAGPFVEVPERLFIARWHDDQCSHRFRERPYYYAGWYDVAQEGRVTFPYWRLGSEYAKVILGASLPRREKAASLMLVSRWWAARLRYLVRDVWFAAAQLTTPAARGAGRPKPGDQLSLGK